MDRTTKCGSLAARVHWAAVPLRRAADELGQTVVLVTHDPIGAAFADRVLFLRDGLLVDALQRPTADGVVARMAVLEAYRFPPFGPSGGKSRHLPPPRGACAATIQCYYVPVVSNTG
jgi:hypothetical protein